MITEDYVSFETAKLLKKKGFNEDCYTCYLIDEIQHYDYESRNRDLIEGVISAPTLQMTMKWLREIHNIDIFPWKIGKGIYSCAIFNSNTGQDLSSDKDFPSEKYEETVDKFLEQNKSKKKQLNMEFYNMKYIIFQYHYDILKIKNNINQNQFKIDCLNVKLDNCKDEIEQKIK